jgi:hypothetical protein
VGRTKSMVSPGEEEQVRRCRRRHDNADIDYSSSSSPVNILHVCINPELPRAFHSLRQLTRPRDESLSPPPPLTFIWFFSPRILYSARLYWPTRQLLSYTYPFFSFFGRAGTVWDTPGKWNQSSVNRTTCQPPLTSRVGPAMLERSILTFPY